MNVTAVPSQIVFPGLAEMLTLAARFEFTVITIAFDAAGIPVTQTAFEVISHVTPFPFTNAALV